MPLRRCGVERITEVLKRERERERKRERERENPVSVDWTV